MKHKQAWLEGILLLLLVLLPAAITYLVLWHTASPIPYMDDYDAILAFANTYQHLPSPTARLLYINDATHVQYKLVLLHGIVAAELGLLHRVSLPLIQWIGNFSLLLTAGCLWQMLPKVRFSKRLLLFMPVSCLVFVMRDSEALGWAMGCLQQVSAMGLCLFALLCFLRDRREWFLCGCFAFVLAAWTSANGFLVVPVALLAMARRQQGRRAVALLVIMLGVLGCYLHGFHPGLDPNAAHAGPAVLPAFYLVLLGNLFSRWWLALPFGFLLMVAAIRVVQRAMRKRGRLDPVSASILFLLLNAALITLGRYRFSLVGALASRYSLYSQVLAALVYLAYVRARITMEMQDETEHGWRAVPASVWLTCAVTCLLFLHYERIGMRLTHERQLASTAHMAAWEHYGPKCSLVAIDIPEVQHSFSLWIPHGSHVLEQSIRLGIYIPPVLPTPAQPPQFFQNY